MQLIDSMAHHTYSLEPGVNWQWACAIKLTIGPFAEGSSLDGTAMERVFTAAPCLASRET
jgi:hypothetical protein